MSFRRCVSIAFLAALFVFTQAALSQAARFEDDLDAQLRSAKETDFFKVYIVMKDRVDLRALSARAAGERLTRAQKHYLVITELQEKAAETQVSLLSSLKAAAKSDVRRVRPFWIANAVALEATARFVERLRGRTDIETVYLDRPLELIAPVEDSGPLAAGAATGIVPGIADTRAPELWAMGINGTGSLACDQDTGEQGDHPAFGSRWRGLDPGVTPAEAWFDPVGAETFPSDSGSHGTHTMGTMIGDDGQGHQVGMAPGAKWIGAKTIDVPGGNIMSDAVAAFMWASDPDGNPATMEDVPDVVNNSWGISGGNCGENFWDSIDAAEAAGVVVVFAAGNEGPGPKSLRSPADRITTSFNTFAIGALMQGGERIASFSSRGPSRCDNVTIKPEICAVGDNVMSSVPPDGYGTMSGTSMATPHVAGAVLLLRQAFPEAMPDEIKMAMYETAVDLGAAGEDNIYGNGRLDVVEAYWWLLMHFMSSDGDLFINKEVYGCRDNIQISLLDADLTDAAIVTAASTSETVPEIVTLAAGATPGYFTGAIRTAPGTPAPDGVLQVADGDLITIAYVDANDGHGGNNVTKTMTALVDCAPPEFAGLTGATPLSNEVELTWDAATDDGPITYRVYRAAESGGEDFNAPEYETTETTFIDPNAPNGVEWFYVVRAADYLGNVEANAVEISALPEGPDRIFWCDFDHVRLDEWTIVDGGSNPVTWNDANGGGRSSDQWQGLFAIADKSTTGEFQKLDEQLISPALDCSHFEGVKLIFTHDFSKGGMEHARVDWSYDAAQWNLIHNYFASDSGRQEFDVPDADLHEQVFFRFYYMNGGMSAEYWGVDNVEVTGTLSTAEPVTTTTTTTTTEPTTTTMPADDDTSADDTTADDDTVLDDDTAADDDTAGDDTLAGDDEDDDTADDDLVIGDDASSGDDDSNGGCCG